MDQYIARQPILDVNKRLYAYELLYRGKGDYDLSSVSGNRATASLLSSTFLTKGIEEISGHRPCFINFTQELIEQRLPVSFPKTKIVVELLEDVKPTPKVIGACKYLRDKGYTIALDDFVYHRRFEPLIELASIIKIDVRLTPLDTIMRTLARLSRHRVKLLAEKVESLEDFEKANKLGFIYFQGYFFSKPERIEIKELSSAKVNLLNLLAEVTRGKTSLKKLEKIISIDIAISYKLLRFLNSAYFYRLQEVKTVKHAMAYLGEKELKRFVMLVIVSELAMDKPGELVRLALVRAKFCELLGESSIYKSASSELFIMGLFSLLDTMLGVSMKEVMGRLPLSDQVKEALINNAGNCAAFLKVAIAFERNQESVFTPILSRLGVDTEHIPEQYLTAVKYANGLL